MRSTPSELIHHCGRFKVRSEWIECRPELAMKIFKDMIVIRCEHLFGSREFSYEAIHKDFAKLEVGALIPWYKVIIRQNGDVSFDNGAEYDTGSFTVSTVKG